MRCRNCFVTVPLVWGLASFAAGCCPTTAGPTAQAASYSMTLAPGEVRFFDADTPDSTTQINLTFRIESVDALLRLRQIDPGCLPGPGDACQNFLRYDAHAAARRGRDVRKRPATPRAPDPRRPGKPLARHVDDCRPHHRAQARGLHVIRNRYRNTDNVRAKTRAPDSPKLVWG